VAGGRLHPEVRAPLRPDGRSPPGVDAPIAEGRSPFHGLIHEQIAVRKMRWRRKKIAGAFWSLHVSLHDGTDELACHVSEIGKKKCYFLCRRMANIKGSKWRGDIHKDGI
jgi:hypothetical protein